MSEYKKRTCCACCKNSSLKTIISFGEVPLAGNFPKKEELENTKKYELSILFCEKCALVQTNSIIDSDYLFKDYRYRSSIGLSKYFSEVAKLYITKFDLTKQSKVLEIGSNDGVLLKPLHELGIDIVGVEPSININKIASDLGLKTVNDYFHLENAKKYFSSSKFDLVISNNCFAHIDDINSIVEGVKYCLADNGTFVIEVHYLKKLIEEFQFDFIYHEHLYYYSFTALNNLFKQHGMVVVDFDDIPIHSGSIRVYAKKSGEPDAKVQERLNLENRVGLSTYEYFETFSNNVTAHIEKIKSLILELRKSNLEIFAYGASGRGNMLLNVCGFTENEIKFIIDESPERYNRYIPSCNIPIYDPTHLNQPIPNYVFVLAWNYIDMIKKKLEGKNLKYILPFPTPKIDL